MPFGTREAVVGLALGMLGNALAIVLGLVVPLGDPLRDRVDDTLLLLGVIGVLLTLLLPRSGMIEQGRATRRALALYGALSLLAVLLADFGALRRVGMTVKLAAAALLGLAFGGLRRRD